MRGLPHTRPLLVTLLVAALAGPVATASADGPPVGGLQGVAVADDETPLAGATVEVRRDDAVVATAVTGTDGSWTVADLPADERPYGVEVSAPGHAPRLVGEYDGASLPEPHAYVAAHATTGVPRVVLPRLTATIRGRVVGGDGAPLAGVTVSAVRGGWGARVRQLRATTAADGRYAVRVTAGAWSMAADRSDLVTRWTGPTAPHERPFPQDAAQQPVAAGEVREGVDFRLLPRPARSCWAPGVPVNGRRTLAWIAGAAERPDPSWPPADTDLCGAPHAATQITPQNDGPFVTGGQRMDLMEAYYAAGGDGPPIAMDRKSAEQNELETWIAQNGDLIRAWMDSGLPPPAERPTGYPPGHPLYVAPARPTTALRPLLTLPSAVAVPRDRFTVRNRCSAARPCAGGSLTATVARGRAVPVARGRLARSTRSRKVTLRLTSRGRHLLRTKRSLPVRIAWTASGEARAVSLGTLRLRAPARR